MDTFHSLSPSARHNIERSCHITLITLILLLCSSCVCMSLCNRETHMSTEKTLSHLTACPVNTLCFDMLYSFFFSFVSDSFGVTVLCSSLDYTSGVWSKFCLQHTGIKDEMAKTSWQEQVQTFWSPFNYGHIFKNF